MQYNTCSNANRNLYLSVYGVLGLLQSVAIMLGTVVLSVGTLNAATSLHGTMLSRCVTSLCDSIQAT